MVESRRRPVHWRPMRNPWEPTDDEIAAWAYRPDAVEPVQDWDLSVASIDRAPLLIRLAADPACPTRDYFLRVLYLLVGDRVRASPGNATAWERVERVLCLAEAVPYARITGSRLPLQGTRTLVGGLSSGGE